MGSGKLATIDWFILAIYFALIVSVGLLTVRFASRSIADYFLGGRRIPWWALGRY
jgi:Na+/proline symporter